MSSVQLASITLASNQDGSSIRAILEWQKGVGYSAYITDVATDSLSVARETVISHDVPAGLRALADLISDYHLSVKSHTSRR